MSRKCPVCGTEYPDEISFCGQDGNLTLQVLPPGEHDDRLGTQLGDYIIVARIADGAMGRVYEGRHAQTRQRVAVKVLHRDVAQDPVAVERFRREAETARELAHPNVVGVIDFGETPDGSNFMTMEYLQGEELGDKLRREGALEPALALRVLCQLTDALEHAHSFGVIHRDLKPDNVFLVKDEAGEIVRVLDFGSVKLQIETGPKLTAFGTTLGSPYYMSPEQAMGKQDVDHRTDVFAATAILYEMLTGKIAFEGTNVAQILMKIMNEQPAPPSQLGKGVPAAVDDVIDKGLRKDKARRYGSVRELANAAVRAFGLPHDAAHWAKAPLAELRAALESAQPPPPRPFGHESVAPPPPAKSAPSMTPATAAARPQAASAGHAPSPMVQDAIAPKSSGAGLFVVGIVVAVGVVVALAVAALFLFL